MSRGSSSASPWPKYGPVPLTRCPDCPRVEPLVRLTCKKTDTGNYGREFVKCESRPQPGKILKQCSYFCWLDAYIEKLQFERSSDLRVDVGRAGEFGQDVAAAAAPAEQRERGTAAIEVATELKKINLKMRQMVELKKQQNMIAVVFYVCVVVIGIIAVFKLGK